eukprot:scaffold255450_cov17-Prasinocladus_malaysianus.AAC.1
MGFDCYTYVILTARIVDLPQQCRAFFHLVTDGALLVGCAQRVEWGEGGRAWRRASGRVAGGQAGA